MLEASTAGVGWDVCRDGVKAAGVEGRDLRGLDGARCDLGGFDVARRGGVGVDTQQGGAAVGVAGACRDGGDVQAGFEQFRRVVVADEGRGEVDADRVAQPGDRVSDRVGIARAAAGLAAQSGEEELVL